MRHRAEGLHTTEVVTAVSKTIPSGHRAAYHCIYPFILHGALWVDIITRIDRKNIKKQTNSNAKSCGNKFTNFINKLGKRHRTMFSIQSLWFTETHTRLHLNVQYCYIMWIVLHLVAKRSNVKFNKIIFIISTTTTYSLRMTK
jgi:hypothetical protein